MDVNELANKAMKGTTTVGMICKDGVVMGADSRVTMDTFIASSEGIKVYKIDEQLGMTVAGSVAFADYLVKLLKVQNEFYKMTEGKPLSPGAATSFLSMVLQENANPYLLELTAVQLIVGGLNKDVPELYELDSLGGISKESKFFSSGTGSLTALGYLESVFMPDMPIEDGVRHAVKAIKIAMKRDSATGDNIKVVAITKKGFKEYSKDELEKISK